MENEKELIEKAKKGNSLAFGKLYDAYRAKGIAIAKQYVKVDADAEDMYQDAFIKVMGAMDRFDESKSFQSWLDVIIVNTCKDFLEKKRATNFTDMEAMSGAEEGEGLSLAERIVETDRDFLPEEVLDRKAVREIVEEVLSDLPDAQREAVVLYYYKEMSVRQIAETYAMPENTVKSNLSYARKKTRSAVEAYQKKHGIRLYSTPAASILLFLFFRLSGAERVAQTVLGGMAASAGAAGSMAGGGAAAGTAAAETAAAGTATAGSAVTASSAGGAAGTVAGQASAAATAAGTAASATAVAGGIGAGKIIAGVAAALVIGIGSFFGIRALLTPEPPAEEVIAEIPQDTAEVPPPEPVAEAPDPYAILTEYESLYQVVEDSGWDSNGIRELTNSGFIGEAGWYQPWQPYLGPAEAAVMQPQYRNAIDLLERYIADMEENPIPAICDDRTVPRNVFTVGINDKTYLKLNGAYFILSYYYLLAGDLDGCAATRARIAEYLGDPSATQAENKIGIALKQNDVDYTFDSYGRVIYGDVFHYTSSYEYDDAGRLITYVRDGASTTTVDGNTTVNVDIYRFTYDAAGRVSGWEWYQNDNPVPLSIIRNEYTETESGYTVRQTDSASTGAVFRIEEQEYIRETTADGILRIYPAAEPVQIQ